LQYRNEALALVDAQEELKVAEVEVKGFDSEIAVLQARKRDFQSKSALIKNNDEYRAALLQIEMVNQAIASVEERQLEAMFKVDQLKEKVSLREKDFLAGKARAQVVLEDLETRRKNCERLISELSESRPGVVAELEEVIKQAVSNGAECGNCVSVYSRLRSSKTYSSLVPCVVPLEDGSCGRCHLKVTAQQRSDVLKSKLVQCPSCGAIVYQE
jgi:predicted  nucleic acid-binding Zn-ribbon protein